MKEEITWYDTSKAIPSIISDWRPRYYLIAVHVTETDHQHPTTMIWRGIVDMPCEQHIVTLASFSYHYQEEAPSCPQWIDVVTGQAVTPHYWSELPLHPEECRM